MFAVSPLSLAATGLYLVVFGFVARSAIVSHQHRQQAWHTRGWLLLAALFAILVILRLFDVEGILRDSVRNSLRQSATYDGRRSFQRPLAAGLIALAGAASFWWMFRTARTVAGRRNVAVMLGLAGGLGMLLLIAMRLVSLHMIDMLLYGPIKFNWFADLGLSCLIAWASWRYVRIVRA